MVTERLSTFIHSLGNRVAELVAVEVEVP